MIRLSLAPMMAFWSTSVVAYIRATHQKVRVLDVHNHMLGVVDLLLHGNSKFPLDFSPIRRERSP
jgi:hypothetical protein